MTVFGITPETLDKFSRKLLLYEKQTIKNINFKGNKQKFDIFEFKLLLLLQILVAFEINISSNLKNVSNKNNSENISSRNSKNISVTNNKFRNKFHEKRKYSQIP